MIFQIQRATIWRKLNPIKLKLDKPLQSYDEQLKEGLKKKEGNAEKLEKKRQKELKAQQKAEEKRKKKEQEIADKLEKRIQNEFCSNS